MPLIDAILRGDATTVRTVLLDFINARTETGTLECPTEEAFEAAVLGAALLGHTDVIRAIVELLTGDHGLPLSFEIVGDDNRAFRLAAHEGHVALVRYLCDLPVNVGIDPAANDNDALSNAAMYEHEDVVRLLCELPLHRGVDPAENHNQALRWAAWKGHIGIVRCLCELPPQRGVDPTDCAEMECNAMQIVAQEGHVEVMRYLCQRGMEFVGDLNQALEKAAEYGQLDMVRYLCELDFDQDLNATLEAAAAEGHLNVVRYLFELPTRSESSSVNVATGSSSTVGGSTASAGSVSVTVGDSGAGVSGGNVDVVPGDARLAANNRALRAAVRHKEVVKYLCGLPPSHGINPAAKYNGVSVLAGAAEHGHLETVRFLCMYRPVDPQNLWDAAVAAAAAGHAEIVAFLCCHRKFKRQWKFLLLQRCTPLRRFSSVFQSVANSLDSADLVDLSARGMWRELCSLAMSWRHRRPLVALSSLRKKGRIAAKTCPAQLCGNAQCRACYPPPVVQPVTRSNMPRKRARLG